VSAFRLAVTAVVLCAGSAGLVAGSPHAGRISGQLTMLERPGVKTKDLATAIVYLQPLDGRGDDDNGSLRDEATIAMRGREFIPHSTVIRSGGSVAFPNQDPFSHNVFSNAEPGSFDLGLYRRGASRVARFGQAGVFPIFCNIHARMVSYVIAVPGRHVATVDADGRFVLDDVPVGTWRLVAWHERAARFTEDIAVSAAGASVQIALDARGHVTAAHLNKFGMPYTSTRSDRY
jgi:plastocyanin